MGTTDAALRAYARTEYPHEDLLWLLSQARREPAVRRSEGSFVRRLTEGLRKAGERVAERVAEKETTLRV